MSLRILFVSICCSIMPITGMDRAITEARYALQPIQPALPRDRHQVTYYRSAQNNQTHCYALRDLALCSSLMLFCISCQVGAIGHPNPYFRLFFGTCALTSALQIPNCLRQTMLSLRRAFGPHGTRTLRDLQANNV